MGIRLSGLSTSPTRVSPSNIRSVPVQFLGGKTPALSEKKIEEIVKDARSISLPENLPPKLANSERENHIIILRQFLGVHGTKYSTASTNHPFIKAVQQRILKNQSVPLDIKG